MKGQMPVEVIKGVATARLAALARQPFPQDRDSSLPGKGMACDSIAQVKIGTFRKQERFACLQARPRGSPGFHKSSRFFCETARSAIVWVGHVKLLDAKLRLAAADGD
ncbi:MAG: hypothetical protein WAU16_02225 [Rhizobiaceae bacterium]